MAIDVRITINGQQTTTRDGATIMEAAQKLGVYVPHFCYHKKLSIAANCRMCMVHVEKAPKALPACATPVVDGMVVRTDSAVAKAAQKSVMEFLLVNHPLDCPICDQGGECQLQDLAVGYGMSRSRYEEEKRVVFEKNLGPLIATDMTRCIHCTRCVRFGREVAGVMELGMVGRGEHAEIMPFVERAVDSELSGNMIDICPVGALTSKPFRYTARPWELQKQETIAAHDSWGSHLCAHVKGGVVKRATPSQLPEVAECWISDRDRFSYEGLAAADRADTPLSNERGGRSFNPTPWKIAAQQLATELQNIARQDGGDKIGFFVSPRATCEEAKLTRLIADSLGCPNVESRLRQRDFSAPRIAGLGLQYANIANLRAVLFVGAQPARELPLLAARLRQKPKRRQHFAINPASLADTLPIANELLAPPNAMANAMTALAKLLGCAVLPKRRQDQEAPLLGGSQKMEAALRPFAEALKKAGENGVIWLGDIAREAAQYGVIASMAQAIAAKTGCAVGALDDSANGIGVWRAGARPAGAANTASLLRANLRAVVLVRCEAEDFAEPALARQMLDQSRLAAALSSFVVPLQAPVSLLLPVAETAETGGAMVNGFLQESTFSAAAPPPGQAREAWKVLRYLGELLQTPNFDFSDLRQVAELPQPADEAAPPNEASETSEANEADKANEAEEPAKDEAQEPASGGFCRLGGAPFYGADMLTRRAAALQKTRQGRAAAGAALNPQDLRALAAKEGDRLALAGNGQSWQATAFADAALAPGVVSFYPSANFGDSNIAVAKAAAAALA